MESEGRVDSVRPIRAATVIESVRNGAEVRCGMDWCTTSGWLARRDSLPSGSYGMAGVVLVALAG